MSRHIRAFVEAWRDESRRRKADRSQRIEREFLPAALEIMDSPPRPLGRIIVWLIIGFAAAAVLWSFLGRVDVVAVSEGRLIPRGRLQAVEPLETGVVRALHVQEGQRVEAGEILIELDRTFTDADADAARSELDSAQLQRARALALLAFIDVVEVDNPFVSLSPAAAMAEQRLIAARIAEHQSRLSALDERANAARASQAQAQARLDQINATLPYVRERLTSIRDLADQGYAPRLQVVELSERLTSLYYQAEAETEAIQQARSERNMIAREREGAQETFRAQAAGELSEAETIIATRAEILEKAEARAALQTLVSPVDGIINEIAVTTLGEVAQPGEPLVTLVPADAELIVEAFILNRDAGFVTVGQEVRVKLEAFPFMRFGHLDGVVEHVSADAMVDQNRGLVYPARVRIDANNIMVDGEPARLVPGMSATVEVKTGKRRIITFITSPIARAVSEAGRER
jgi:hemolysin D